MICKKGLFIQVIIMLVFVSNLNASKAFRIEDVGRPYYIEVDNDFLYIVDINQLKVFSKNNLKFLYTIGKEGEGPGEFTDFPIPQILQDKILVFSEGKISFFKKDGTFIKDERVTNGNQWLKKVTDNRYIGFKTMFEPDEFYITYNLLDDQFKIMKEFYRGKFIIHKNKTRDLFELTFFNTKNERIIYAYNDGSFRVNILDFDGNVIAQIKREEKDLPFTKKDKEIVFHYYKNHPDYRNTFQIWSKNVIIPEKFPSIYSCIATEDKVYIFTFFTKKKEHECFIYDFYGNLKRETFLPIQSECPIKIDLPYTIYENQLFQLIENSNDEHWYLYITDI